MKSLLILLLLYIYLFFLFLNIKSQKISFDKLISFIQATEKKKIISVAGGDSEEVLWAVRKVKDLEIADAILIGDEEKILKISEEFKINITDFQIINIKDESEITKTAVKLVHDNQADMYMKGSVQSSTFLKAILDKKVGLRTERALSGVVVMDIPTLKKTILITDGAVNILMDFNTKLKIIENAVDVAHACGIQTPKVAIISGVSYIDSTMIETVEAAEFSTMQDKGQIQGCIVDGPITLDDAVIPEIAEKGEKRKIMGDADILVFPDIHSGNFAYKAIGHTIKCQNGNLLVGTSMPCIFTSRADGMEVKINSIVLATIYADYLKRKEEEKKLEQ